MKHEKLLTINQDKKQFMIDDDQYIFSQLQWELDSYVDFANKLIGKEHGREAIYMMHNMDSLRASIKHKLDIIDEYTRGNCKL